eukprot:15468354-Alexandrium_andersonii.AAC.1
MIGMCTVLLLPTLRIRERDSASVIGIFADDRNALTASEEQVQGVETAWKDVERATALQDNRG